MQQTVQRGWLSGQGLAVGLRARRAGGVAAFRARDATQGSPTAPYVTHERRRRRPQSWIRAMVAVGFRVGKPVLRPVVSRTRTYLSAPALDHLIQLKSTNLELRSRIERLEAALLSYAERSRASSEEVKTAIEALTKAVQPRPGSPSVEDESVEL